MRLVGNGLDGCAWAFEGAAGDALAFAAALCREDPGFGAALARELGLGDRGAAGAVVGNEIGRAWPDH